MRRRRLERLKLHCRPLDDAGLQTLASSSAANLRSLGLLELEQVTALGLASALRSLEAGDVESAVAAAPDPVAAAAAHARARQVASQ